MDIPKVCLSVDRSANSTDFFGPCLAWRRDNYIAGRQSSHKQWVERCTVSLSQSVSLIQERQASCLWRCQQGPIAPSTSGHRALDLGDRALVFQVLCRGLELSRPASLGLLCEEKTLTFILPTLLRFCVDNNMTKTLTATVLDISGNFRRSCYRSYRFLETCALYPSSYLSHIDVLPPTHTSSSP